MGPQGLCQSLTIDNNTTEECKLQTTKDQKNSSDYQKIVVEVTPQLIAVYHINYNTNLKKITMQIENSRKNIQAGKETVENIEKLKQSFGKIQGVIQGEVGILDGLKAFSKEAGMNSAKDLEAKRFLNSLAQKTLAELKGYLDVAKDNFVISYKHRNDQDWGKIYKDIQKSVKGVLEEADTLDKIFAAAQKLLGMKDSMLAQMFKVIMYKKNLLWRDLNAPYQDYIHGEVKGILNLLKGCEEKYGYTPSALEFIVPKPKAEGVTNLHELTRIALFDCNEMIEGLKNYSRLAGQEQLIEDIAKNKHIVKGLRQRIQRLTINYNSLLQKYRSLQMNKGVAGEDKSMGERIEELQSAMMKKEQQNLELKQSSAKADGLYQSLREKNKDLEEEVGKFQKFQMPKIRELQVNQKNILEEFAKVRRDLDTYSGLVHSERDQKLKLIKDLQHERQTLESIVSILGRERRKIKELKEEIKRQEQIIMEFADKLPSE